MPVYEYKALNKRGKQISGMLDAGDIKIAKNKLRASQIFPVSLKEVNTEPNINTKTGFTLFSPRINASETAVMTRQLATLISAGFPLITALNTMLPQIKKQSFKRVISKIKDSIEEGAGFADALARYSGIFSGIYINMVRAGEASGTLGIVLERLADISEKQNKMRRKIQAALAYPILMALIGTGVLFFLLTVIVPNITAIFEEMNQSLPFTTQALIDISNILRQWWWLLAGLIVSIAVVSQTLLKRPAIRLAADRVILRVPVVGSLKQKIAVARFSRTLGSLLENGVTLLDALKIVRKVAGNMVIEAAIHQAGIEVEKGRELGEVLGKSDYFPYLAVQMIKVGEQTGRLEDMLKKTARVYDEEIETTVVGLTSLLEPVIILIMAVVVGFIVLSICLPIFEMNQLVS
ncbi:type II secretion system inner membrane protein GspF [Desulfobacter latus]|uniref:General secretion pathway protein F n=1 Tax=Desulfobacter latus TaxID=2292 RepID=A0A850T3I5_9BACT|nr:type II secretion system inner membrane protein GspF [Desulfobacter latus]NWH05651.1 type II secretion system inner membrane protein GspF [Desulfobacter latus]